MNVASLKRNTICPIGKIPLQIFFAVIIFILTLMMPISIQAVGTDRAEFSGIRFKTRYQTVKIDTPILLETEPVWDSGYVFDINDAAKLLRVTLKNPETAKFKFLMKITPRDFEKWQKSAAEGAKDIFLTNNQRTHFVSGKNPIKIGEITINTENFEWLEKYKLLIAKNFKNCKTANSPEGYSDMVCPPLWIEAKITKIERSVLSPFLPTDYIFPHSDYFDIYVEIEDIYMNTKK